MFCDRLVFLFINACRLVKERNPGGGVQEGEVGIKEPVTDKDRGGVMACIPATII